MRALQMQAIKKAGQIRSKLNLDLFEPINIFDACIKLGVNVRFVPINMEGMYVNKAGVTTSEILLSSLRPFARRVYTCGHELGHHIFGHGTKIDGLNEDGTSKAIYDNDELLVDTFAGALLMPLAGIEIAFQIRNCSMQDASPIQYYTISSIFGVGYSTLITHCRVNGLINELKAMALLKLTPAKLLQHLIGLTIDKPHFKIIDEAVNVSVIDLETGGYIFLPEHATIEGDHLEKTQNVELGCAFVAKKSGIVRAMIGSAAFFIRIQNAGYIGLAENRHLEE